MMPYVKGEVRITMTDINTGEVVDSYGPSENMVVDIGVSTMWKRASMLDELNQFQLHTLHLGDDLGDDRWGIFNPEPPSRMFDQTNQNITYVIPETTYEYPTDEVLRATAYINGSELMEDNWPLEVDYRFTSMTLRFNNGEVFAFKRFPIRSISRHVHVTFDWRFTIVNAEEWCSILEAEGNDNE